MTENEKILILYCDDSNEAKSLEKDLRDKGYQVKIHERGGPPVLDKVDNTGRQTYPRLIGYNEIRKFCLELGL